MEKVHKNKNDFKSWISTLANLEHEELKDINDLDEDTFSQISHVWARHGIQPYRHFNSNKSSQGGQGAQSGTKADSNGNKNRNSNIDDWKCWYCNSPSNF